MSKSPFSFTPEPSPVSSQQKPQTFDFSTLLAQKAMEKLEQEREIAQQEAAAKQETEKSIKRAALESSLEKLESACVINADY